MNSKLSKKIYDWLIIGGGIHGVHISIRILSEDKTKETSIRIVDPNPYLLSNWKRQTLSTKMSYLRSPSVHHLAEDPFDLRKFAGKKPRNRIGKFIQPYSRPKLKFFNRHCDYLIGKYNLDRLHIQDRVEQIYIGDKYVTLRTSKGCDYL